MFRYINTEALPQKRYTDSKQLASSIADYMIAFDNGWNACIDEIGKQSTISPDEMRGVGKWERVETEFGLRCSKCGKLLDDYVNGGEWVDLVEIPNYCPNCGAKMEVE